MGRLTSDPLFGQVSALDALLNHTPTNQASRDGSFERHLQDARRQSSSPAQSADQQPLKSADRDQRASSEASQSEPVEGAKDGSPSAASTDEAPAEASSAKREESPITEKAADEEALVEAAAQTAASDAAVAAAAGQSTTTSPAEPSGQVDGKADPLLASVPGDAAKTKLQTKHSASQTEPTQNSLDPTAKSVDGSATEGVAEESASQRAENAAAVESAIEATNGVNLKEGTQAPAESAATPLTAAGQTPQAAAAQGESSQSTTRTAVESPDVVKPARSNSPTARRDRSEAAPSEAAAAAPQAGIANDVAPPLAALDAPPETAEAETNIKSAGDTARQPSEATTLSTAEAAANLPAAAAPPKGIAASIAGGAAHRGGQGAEISESDRARFVQRVSRAFQSVGEDGGQLRLRLSPPELGSMRLEIMVNKGVLTAHVEAETPQARQLLLDNLPALRERLQEQNIKVERFDVDVAGQSSSGWSQESARQRQQENQQRSANLKPRAAAVTDAVSPLAERQQPRSGDGKLNVVI